jgi:hypothetical protein
MIEYGEDDSILHQTKKWQEWLLEEKEQNM